MTGNPDAPAPLSPLASVGLAWTIAGKFTSEPESKMTAQLAEDRLKAALESVGAGTVEQQYLSRVETAILAAVRNLEVIYKGRELNFAENERLRQAYMENVRENIEFGRNARSYLKALPTMAIAGPGGTALLVNNLPQRLTGEHETLFLWLLGAALSGIGYWIYRGVMFLSRKRTQTLYVQQDCERNLYYSSYVTRVEVVLAGLYSHVDRVHSQTFGAPYPHSEGNAATVVGELLAGIQPRMCRYVHEHMRAGVVTPELWPLCEAGGEGVESCPHWRKE